MIAQAVRSGIMIVQLVIMIAQLVLPSEDKNISIGRKLSIWWHGYTFWYSVL